jgi:hypothetical protein
MHIVAGQDVDRQERILKDSNLSFLLLSIVIQKTNIYSSSFYELHSSFFLIY